MKHAAKVILVLPACFGMHCLNSSCQGALHVKAVERVLEASVQQTVVGQPAAHASCLMSLPGSQQNYDAGNKEAHWEGEPTTQTHPSAGTPYEAAQKHRRFQVYVHSKLMIVDDEVSTASVFAQALVYAWHSAAQVHHCEHQTFTPCP